MLLVVRVYDVGLSVCRLLAEAEAPVGVLRHPFSAFFRTRDEVTLVCPTDLVPGDVQAEHGFIPFGLVGPFPFELTGILTQVANPLADAGVSIVALSTFDTDYVLIKAAQRAQAIDALRRAGHSVEEDGSDRLPGDEGR
jgi:hypothetical protein